MAKILYFTAGTVPTSGELTEIDNIKKAVTLGDTVEVRNGAANVSQNYGAAIESSDFVEGTLPASTDYDGVDDFGDNDTNPVVETGDTIAVKNSADSVSLDGTASVESGVVTVDLDATDTLLSSGDTLTGVTPSGSYTNTITFTVAAGAITAVALS